MAVPLLLEPLERLFDELFTRFKGKPQPHQKPLFRFSGATWWGLSTTALVGGVAANAGLVAAIPNIGLWAAPAVIASGMLTIITTGRLRNQAVTFGHHAVHGAIFKSSKLNRLVAEIASTVTLAQNPDDYKRDHVGGHHRRSIFTTANDPDAAFLLELSFRPRMKKAETKRQMLRTLFSPRFHALFFKARARSAWVTASWRHRAMVAAWLSLIATAAATMPLPAFIVAIALPLGPLYHASALLQFASEHRWLVTKVGPSKDLDAYLERCAGRFSGEPLPSRTLTGAAKAMAWAGWVLRTLFVHAPWRFGVVVGDLPAHDWHHFIGLLKHDPHTWQDAIFERQRAIDEGDGLRLADRELWGPFAAIDWVCEGLENAEE
jgi:fatty acid desaturase